MGGSQFFSEEKRDKTCEVLPLVQGVPGYNEHVHARSLPHREGLLMDPEHEPQYGPVELPLDDLRALGQKTQITLRHCIQGWSGIAA